MSQVEGEGAGAPPSPSQAPSRWAPSGWAPWARETAMLAVFLAAGIAVTWPRASYLAGQLPKTPDQAEYVWNMWWIAHQVIHLGNPWYTRSLAAPVGVQLGFDTLTPLLGLLMTPVTLLFGPSASYNLLAIAIPGLAAYAMYRAARLWLPSLPGAAAAGAFFGLSTMLAFQDWFHQHTAAGCVFLPLTLETAIRLRREPSTRRGVILGVVLGASMLVDQELSLMAVGLAALVVIPWLVRSPQWAAFRATAVMAVTGLVVASPQLYYMAQALGQGHSNPSPYQYVKFAAELPSEFAPSPQLASYGLHGLASIYQQHTDIESIATFGFVFTTMAVLGLLVGWRRRHARPLGLLWLGCAALALGPTLYLAGKQYVPIPLRWEGTNVSLLMPDTWLIRVPGLASFREPDRIALLGMVAAALLAGVAVEWLLANLRPAIIAVVVLGLLEAGWAAPGQITMPTALPALDQPIAADHSGSLVVDVPFGIRGIPFYGKELGPDALVIATADGHPRADSYTSWVPQDTLVYFKKNAFYSGLVNARSGQVIGPAHVAAARRELPSLHIGWVLLWLRHWVGHSSSHYTDVTRYLTALGFRFDYEADKVDVYRPGG